MNNSNAEREGLLLVDKPLGKSSFSLVGRLRKLLGVKKIGHAGTLDPLATGVMIMLVGRKYTKLSDKLLNEGKEYIAELHLGVSTASFDAEGEVTKESPYIPSQEEIEEAVARFCGEIEQVPPMFSAKKVGGKKLYHLAREGKSVERKAVAVKLETKLLSYHYPKLLLQISCSKGTYIRSVADDMGELLTCGAHLSSLRRVRSGDFKIDQCIDGKLLFDEEVDLEKLLHHLQPYAAMAYENC